MKVAIYNTPPTTLKLHTTAPSLVSNTTLQQILMPPPYDSPAFNLHLLPTPYKVTRLNPSEPLPQKYIDALTGPSSSFAGDGKLRMLSVTRTSEEVSIVQEGLGEEGEWRCVKIAGPMAFGEYLLHGVCGECDEEYKLVRLTNTCAL